MATRSSEQALRESEEKLRTLAETTLHINNGIVTRYTGGYDYSLEKSGLNDDRSAVTA